MKEELSYELIDRLEAALAQSEATPDTALLRECLAALKPIPIKERAPKRGSIVQAFGQRMDTPADEYHGGGEWQVFPYRWTPDELWSDTDFEVTHWLPLSVKPPFKSKDDDEPLTLRVHLLRLGTNLKCLREEIEHFSLGPFDSEVGEHLESLRKDFVGLEQLVRVKIDREPNPFNIHPCCFCGGPSTHRIVDLDDVPEASRWSIGDDESSWYFCDEHGRRGGD